MKRGHVPTRQCVVCKKRIAKARLLRFARQPAGWVADAQNRQEGRGAYLCSPECAQGVAKNKRYRTLAAAAAGALWATITEVKR